MLLRQGVFLLATLCLNDRLFVEHRVDVEHQYINVLSSVNRLYKRITGLISEAEGENKMFFFCINEQHENLNSATALPEIETCSSWRHARL